MTPLFRIFTGGVLMILSSLSFNLDMGFIFVYLTAAFSGIMLVPTLYKEFFARRKK